MNRESFIFYGSFFEALSCLEDDVRLKCYDAVIGYALTGTEPELEGVPRAVFALIKPQIDANYERYVNGCKGAEYGKRGGRPPKNPIGVSSENPIGVIDENPIGVSDENPKETPNENENVNVNVNDNEKEKKKTNKFVRPSLEEVKAYCQERNNGVNPEAFIDFYESKGWKVGNQSMKDWKAAVRTWEKRDNTPRSPSSFDDISPQKFNKVHNYPERENDYGALGRELMGLV